MRRLNSAAIFFCFSASMTFAAEVDEIRQKLYDTVVFAELCHLKLNSATQAWIDGVSSEFHVREEITARDVAKINFENAVLLQQYVPLCWTLRDKLHVEGWLASGD